MPQIYIFPEGRDTILSSYKIEFALLHHYAVIYAELAMEHTNTHARTHT